jgi:hypothetical protein
MLSSALWYEISAFYKVFIVQAYQTSQYLVPRGDIFLGKWHSPFAGSSDGKISVQSACALNTRYILCSQLPFRTERLRDARRSIQRTRLSRDALILTARKYGPVFLSCNKCQILSETRSRRFVPNQIYNCRISSDVRYWVREYPCRTLNEQLCWSEHSRRKI